jgi:hypothetical protein
LQRGDRLKPKNLRDFGLFFASIRREQQDPGGLDKGRSTYATEPKAFEVDAGVRIDN